jgi:AbrB family looped-hinge helix DNA binding protein
MATVKISQRGQITIPSEVRRRAKLEAGDSLALVVEGDKIILLPLTQTLLDLRGSVPVSGVQDFKAIRKQVIDKKSGISDQYER